MHPETHNLTWEALRGVLGGLPVWTVVSFALRSLPTPDPTHIWLTWGYNIIQFVAANPDMRVEPKHTP